MRTDGAGAYRERTEGVFVKSIAVRPGTVCLLNSLETSNLELADVAPYR